MNTMTIDTEYGLFTIRPFFDAGIGEGIEAKSETGDIIQLFGYEMPDENLTHDVNRIINLVEEEYENQIL